MTVHKQVIRPKDRDHFTVCGASYHSGLKFSFHWKNVSCEKCLSSRPKQSYLKNEGVEPPRPQPDMEKLKLFWSKRK